MKLKKFEQKVWVFLVLFSLVGCTKTTFIELPQVFTNNMVLQQQTQVKVWGKTDAGVKVIIEGSWGNAVTCIADESGNWIAELPTIGAGGPFELKISSGKIVKVLSNIMLGEVWICSGQSNMEMPLISNWAFVDSAAQEVAQANYSDIRLFTVQKNIAFTPIDTITTEGWVLCDTNTVKNFSATAYFFGRKLYQELGVPIGLIHSSWGGTVAEAWTSKNALLNLDDFAETAEKISRLGASRDSLVHKFKADSTQMMLEIAQADKGLDGGVAVYAEVNLDDTDWFAIDLPKMWEETELGNYDGSTWFRKEVVLTEQLAKSELTLCYGAPDDWDEAWINGVKVGENRVWGQLRKYKIPEGVAKAGKNTLTLRVYDYTGGGGFMGEANDYKLVSSTGKSIPIAQGWLAKKGFDFKDIKTIPVSLTDPNQATVLFNAMLNPIIPFTLQGAIWYQGESNAGRAFQYRELFKTMITDWRAQWNQGDFAFLFVQLANYLPRNTQPVEDTWAELREAQTMALELPNTGMAVSIDIGNALDIHPGNKQEVGNRLALNALANVYEKELPFSGPIYNKMEIKDNVIELTFNFVYDGLSASNGKDLKGFAIAGSDKVFVWADVRITDNKVVVSSPKVKQPVAVRYAWSSNPECNLINSANLPASPFRTDTWKGITE
jgi:sialate O-acetylesterase